jgi:uncharacterized membrane protein
VFAKNPGLVVASAWALALVTTSGAACSLLALRVVRTGEWRWSFLVFNLALAWAPLLFAAGVVAVERARMPRWALVVPAAGWLIFLPNSPYLWTDLIHLAGHERRLFVTDFLVITSFAVAGLVAGYASLYLVHSTFERAFGRIAGWLLVAAVLPLVSLGIYIGRVLRWNSWEAATRLDDFVSLAVWRLGDPLGSPALIAACILMTVCLAAGYLVAWCLTRYVTFASASPRSNA